MKYIIGCDAHKRFSQMAVFGEQSKTLQQMRVNHQPGAIYDFLAKYPERTLVGLESVGNWCLIVDEIEAAGCQPLMAHAAKAKMMMGNVSKTNKLSARCPRPGDLTAKWNITHSLDCTKGDPRCT